MRHRTSICCTRRLERAAALLRTTDRSVADICMTVGLRSVGSFTTSFGRLFGLSPTAYRDSFPPAVTRARIPTCIQQAYARPQSRSQEVAIVLMAVPGPPVFDEETRDQIEALVAKGAATGLFFSTDDIKATYEELKGRGVEFQQEPTEQPYGIDAGFRDPSGNQMRVAQLSG